MRNCANDSAPSPKKATASADPSPPPRPVDVVPPEHAEMLSLVLTGRECELIRNESFAHPELVDRL